MTVLLVIAVAVIVLGLVFLILGPRRQPEVGRSLGPARRDDRPDE